LPLVLEEPDDVELRTHLLEGAAHAGEALALAGLGLGHAMAQAVGGAYGLPHGTMNAIVLPAALRFNAALAPEAVRRFGEAIGAADDPAVKVEKLAALSGPTRLREVGVPQAELPALAEAAAARAGNRANPRPATVEELLELYRSIW
jgi:alcohol dehydrogenase class IV